MCVCVCVCLCTRFVMVIIEENKLRTEIKFSMKLLHFTVYKFFWEGYEYNYASFKLWVNNKLDCCTSKRRENWKLNLQNSE